MSRYGKDNEEFETDASVGEGSVLSALAGMDKNYASAQLNGAGLKDTLKITKDEDGNARWLFMTWPAEMAGVLEYGLNSVKPWLNEKGISFLYDKTSKLWKEYFTTSTASSAHSAGLNVAKLFTAALIGAEPIDELIHLRSKHRKERQELFKAIAPALDAAGGKYKNNEVLQTAFDRLHEHGISKLKQFATNIPTLVATVAYAVGQYGNLRHEKQNLFNKTQGLPFEEQKIKPKDKDSSVGPVPVMLGVEAFSKFLESSVRKDAKRNRKSIALDLILQLKERIDSGAHARDLKDRILEIFQQNELDHGRPAIGEKLLPKLMPSIEVIADVIADERLNPLALINLVGEGKIIQQREGMRVFATGSQTETLIEEQLKVLSQRELMTAEEFFSNFAEPRLVEQTLKQNLASMKGLEKALFADLFPQDILLRAGLKKSEVIELHKVAHDHMYGFVAACVAYLAKKEPDVLKKHGIREEDIRTLNEFTETLQDKGLDTAKLAVDGRDKTIIDIIRTAFLHEQMETKANPWTERVKESRAAAEELKQAVETRAAEPRIHERSFDGEEDEERPHRHRRSAVGREAARRRRRDEEPSEEVWR